VKVYLAYFDWGYGDMKILGVYSSEERAKIAAEDSIWGKSGDAEIEEYEVDE
jgi:hypothetical protein